MIADIHLGTRLYHALQRGIEAARATDRPRLVSVVERVHVDVDVLSVFGRCRSNDRFYWRPPDGPTLAGCGAAYSLLYRSSRLSEDEWANLLEGAVIDGPNARATGPLLLGSLAFDPLRPKSDLWDGFPLGRLLLPRFLVTAATETYLTINTLVREESDAERLASETAEELDRLLSGPGLPDVAPEAIAVGGGSGDTFCTTVARAVDEIRLGAVDKIVVARATQVHGTWDVASVLRRLDHSQPDCTTFAVANGDASFVGATPEWLVRLQNREARISCLAGTAGRGRDDAEDRRLGECLLASPKDRREHALVLEMILSSLHGLALDVQVPDSPSVLTLPNLQHLSTPVTAVTTARTILSLVKRLHPTPAVAGFPREVAMRFLRRHENLDRGAYAGPVGWLDRNGDGEFAVGLRSALLRHDVATAFAGCGIVADSEPDSEYRESSLKLRPILSVLGAPLES